MALLMLLVCGLALSTSACHRGGATEDQLPHGKASPALSLAGKPSAPCFERPKWALHRGKYVVELVHETRADDHETHGTGFRLSKDRSLETYDDIVLSTGANGRPKLKRVPGKWSQRGVVDEEYFAKFMEKVRRWVKRNSRSGAIDTGKHDAYRTWLRVAPVGARSEIEVCYRGSDAPESLSDLQRSIERLVGHARRQPQAAASGASSR